MTPVELIAEWRKAAEAYDVESCNSQAVSTRIAARARRDQVRDCATKMEASLQEARVKLLELKHMLEDFDETASSAELDLKLDEALKRVKDMGV